MTSFSIRAYPLWILSVWKFRKTFSSKFYSRKNNVAALNAIKFPVRELRTAFPIVIRTKFFVFTAGELIRHNCLLLCGRCNVGIFTLIMQLSNVIKKLRCKFKIDHVPVKFWCYIASTEMGQRNTDINCSSRGLEWQKSQCFNYFRFISCYAENTETKKKLITESLWSVMSLLSDAWSWKSWVIYG